jgi:hypothetical protein
LDLGAWLWHCCTASRNILTRSSASKLRMIRSRSGVLFVDVGVKKRTAIVLFCNEEFYSSTTRGSSCIFLTFLFGIFPTGSLRSAAGKFCAIFHSCSIASWVMVSSALDGPDSISYSSVRRPNELGVVSKLFSFWHQPLPLCTQERYSDTSSWAMADACCL